MLIGGKKTKAALRNQELQDDLEKGATELETATAKATTAEDATLIKPQTQQTKQDDAKPSSNPQRPYSEALESQENSRKSK